MTTTELSDRPRREHTLTRSGTKPADGSQSIAIGRRMDDPDGPEVIEHTEAPIETDGGLADENEGTGTLRTYTNDEYSYRLAYPADWTAEPDPDGGATFEAPWSAAGAAVFIKERIGVPPAASAAAFLDELDGDEHVHALELLAQRDTELESGQTGQVLECAYIGDSCNRWRLSYLFVRADDIGYTLGIDWNDTAEFDAIATAMVESFALGAS